MRFISLVVVSFLVAFASPVIVADDVTPIPADKGQVEAWFKAHVKPLAERKGTLDPALAAAEAAPQIINVGPGGPFKTISDAVKSVPVGNAKRVIIKIAPGVYREKVTIDIGRPYITLVGKPGAETNITFDGTSAKYGTVESATLIVWATNFVAANLNVINTSPMPKPGTQGQALAVRINGDKGAFYNCKFYGFQDTLCDDRGNHLFKDCHIEGTYDFIFGRGASLYLNSQLHAVGDGLRVIAAHNRDSPNLKNGFAFVHCKVTGVGQGIYLGRSWMSHPRVIYAYTEMSSVVNPTGWADNKNKAHDKTVFYGEYMCTGPGSNKAQRVKHTQEIDANEAKEFLTLGYIQGSKWLLPPPSF